LTGVGWTGVLPESGAGWEYRRGTVADRVDDLAAVDAMEVDAGDSEVGVLALDHDQRDPFVRHLDSVCVPQLVRCEASSDARRVGSVMELLAFG
jgi:hypothetical protein